MNFNISKRNQKEQVFKLLDNYLNNYLNKNSEFSIQSYNCNGANNGPLFKNRLIKAIKGKLSTIMFYQEVRYNDIIKIIGIKLHNIIEGQYYVIYNNKIVGMFSNNRSVIIENNVKKVNTFNYGCLVIINTNKCHITNRDNIIIPNYYKNALSFLNKNTTGIKSTPFIKVNYNNNKFIVMSIHAPNGSTFKGKNKRDIFLQSIISQCYEFINKGYIPIICGDFNALPEEMLVDFINENNMKICNYNKNVPTHESLESDFKGVLDYALIPKYVHHMAHLVNFNEYIKKDNNDHAIIYDWMVI